MYRIRKLIWQSQKCSILLGMYCVLFCLLFSCLICDWNGLELILNCLWNSILNEPSLGEWTSRAELCDNLHVPVGLSSQLLFRNRNLYIYFLTHQIILQVRIAVVGKYTGLSDAYLSVLKVDITHYLSVDSVWITKWFPCLGSHIWITCLGSLTCFCGLSQKARSWLGSSLWSRKRNWERGTVTVFWLHNYVFTYSQILMQSHFLFCFV